jgi:serine/threonine protein kinase
MYQMHSTPKRILTKLADGVRYEQRNPRVDSFCRNDGYDNADGDYICKVGDVLFNPEGVGFEIIDQLGKGTFGQVMKCANVSDRSQSVAIKIVKNKPAYFQQGLVEVRILQVLNKSFDLRVVKMMDYFVFRKHLCIVFELLSVNLYDVIKHNNFRGLPFSMVRSIVDQLTRQLVCLKLCHVVHCDLKPENILLTTKRNTKIKLIDFGSAAFEGQQIYTYIQSRFYRSVDVILGFMPFTPAIDMWSLGCIVAELYLGLPLFPGHSEYDQLCRIIELLGPIPDELLERGKNTRKFYVRYEQPHKDVERTGSVSRWRLRSSEEYEEATSKKEKPSKKHIRASSVRELIMAAPVSNTSQDDEGLRREKILSFVMSCLEYDPVKRISPAQAIGHPLFDDSVGLDATLAWRPRPDEYCTKKLSEDPNSFIYHSGGLGDSGLVDVSASLTSTPVKQTAAQAQPLQVHNMQRPVSSMGDDGLAVSYRPALAKPTPNVTAQMSPSKLVAASPTTVLRGGIPFSPGTNRLPPPTAYFSPNHSQRPRAQSNIEQDLVLRWP